MKFTGAYKISESDVYHLVCPKCDNLNHCTEDCSIVDELREVIENHNREEE